MRIRHVMAAMALAVAAVMAASVPATATVEPVAQPAFIEQAHALGMSEAQASDLQQQVDAHIAELGGTQVAINKIDLDGKGFVLLTLPGETYARDLSKVSPAGAGSCPFLYLCAFKGTNFTGNIIGYTTCAADNMPWSTQGSYVNNQTGGTVGTFFIIQSDGSLRRSNTGPAYFERTPWDWSITDSIDPC